MVTRTRINVSLYYVHGLYGFLLTFEVAKRTLMCLY